MPSEALDRPGDPPYHFRAYRLTARATPAFAVQLLARPLIIQIGMAIYKGIAQKKPARAKPSTTAACLSYGR